MTDKVLSISLRPHNLDEIVGQDDVVNSIKTQFESGRVPHFFLITGATGSGKCLGYNTPVIMYDGSIKMVQDIVMGDKLMGDDSTPRNVLNTTKGQEKMYKVSQNYGDDYIVNESHILSLKISLINEGDKNHEIMDVPVKNYLKLTSESKRLLKGYKTSINFESKEVSSNPYFLGTWLNVDVDEYSIESVVPCCKHIPDEYKFNDRDKQLSLLAGLIDADGWSTPTTYGIMQKSEQLAKDIQFVARSLGFSSTMEKMGLGYRQVIYGKGIEQIPCLLHKKHTTSSEHLDCLEYGIKVEEVDQSYYDQGDEYRYYYGFEIDGNRRFLLGDHTVTHNTTLARIIALKLQGAEGGEGGGHKYEKYDIKEINASDKNGVDDIRELLETIRYKPLHPSLAKVIIMDEAHQLTTQAQNALLKDTEDTPEHLYFIFCTNNDSKILPSLKRRAYIINTHGINKSAIRKLLLIAKKKSGFKGEITGLEEALVEYEIDSPGLILQAAEKFFNDVDVTNCIFSAGSDGTVDTRKLCNLVLKGNWKEASVILKLLKKEEVIMTKMCILGYFKTVLLSSGNVNIAKAMKIISEECYDLPVFLANLCIACEIVRKV